MAPLVFPPNPAIGQTFQQWLWDGQKWICNCGGTGGPVVGDKDMPINMQLFTASGTYTPSPGMVSAIVECVGGGGGGGNAGNTIGFGGAGGGGSGGYSRSLLSAAQIGTTQVITIGAGGGPQANGLATSFGTLVVANGGLGGAQWGGGTFGDGGLGAPRGTGQFTLPGTAGTPGTTTIYTTSPIQGVIWGGPGGALWGGSTDSVVQNGTDTNGAAAAPNTGAGGNGAVVAHAAPTVIVTGGAGGSGWCLVTEYS